jgi:hypothetical protein
MEPLQALEKRTAELPEPVKERFRDDPDIRQLLEGLRALTERIEGSGDVQAQDLLDVEGVQANLVSVWTAKLEVAEVELKISQSKVPGLDPCCRYCGAVFQTPDPSTVRSAWSRLRKHVERLHPKEWKAALDAAG